VDVPRFLKVPPALHEQARNGLYVVLGAFVLRMPLSVFSSAHAGLQISDRLVWWNVGGSMLASVAMVAAATATGRVDIAIAVQLALSLASTVCAVRLGCRIAPTTRPAFSARDLAVGWNLMRSGLVYYVLQLEVAIIGSIDNLVIAKVLGVESVALYSVAQRLISVAFSMVYSLGASFWGGVSHAIGTGDIPWIRTEAARLRKLGTLWMAVVAGGFTAVGVPFIDLWTGHRLLIDPWLPVALGTYFACLGHTMIDASILNGAEKIRQQVVTVGLDAGLNLGLSVWLARHIGYVGVGAGTAIAYLACTFLPLQIFSWRLVVRGPRPPFWTRSLSAAILAIGTGFVLDRFMTHTLGWGSLVRLLAGGVCSLLLTLLFIRTIVGRGGIDVLVRTFRSARVIEASAGARPA
jgi:O-antigen/teichoic acid export membrane protein